VLVLRYFEDLTEAQTADVLGIRIGTVKSQARDGLARLRDLVRQHDPVRQHDLMPDLVPLSPTEARTEVRPQAPTEVRP
jgi:hypothetical protein